MPKLTRPAFTAWLASKEPDTVVGIAGSRLGCPLANHLTEKIQPPNGAYIEVDGKSWDIISRRALTAHPLPRWAAAFIDAVDDSPLNARITAAEALRLLATAEYARE